MLRYYCNNYYYISNLFIIVVFYISPLNNFLKLKRNFSIPGIPIPKSKLLYSITINMQ